MPTKLEAVTFVDNPQRTLTELEIACAQAQLETDGTPEELRIRLINYLADFTEQDDIVCLNPEPPIDVESA